MQRTMSNGLALAILLIFCTVGATPASAQTWKTIKGVQYFSTSIWTNELPVGEPVVAFPKGCVGDACQFSIFMEYQPGIGLEAAETCVNDPATAFWDCEIYDTCVAWVEFGPAVIPLHDWHGVAPGTDIVMDHALVGVAFLDRADYSIWPIWSGHDRFHGHAGQILNLLDGAFAIFSDGLCRLGISAAYHPSVVTIFDKGLWLPR